jgi:murein DD-endopeptidase MepM/ murein hydrolase activator NlpD
MNSSLLKRALLALVFLFALPLAHASKWFTDNVPPGGVLAIDLPKNFKAYTQLPFNLTEVFTQQGQTLIGIPLKQEPGEQTISWVDTQDKEHSKKFTVINYPYPTQHLTIKNKRKVNPNNNDMTRITSESKRMKTIYHSFTPNPTSMDWILPVAGRQSSAFGLKRFFNNQPRNPHSGLDVAVPTGTPIIAPTKGKVVLTGDFFFNGNSVFLDHGQGLVTLYCHMNEISVKEGQWVEQGEVLGTVGKTGRATGPHLHWGVSLNNARVDPRLFLPDSELAKLTEK